jgi:cell division protein FtsB
MSGEHNIEIEEIQAKIGENSSPLEKSPENIEALEEEFIKLAEEDGQEKLGSPLEEMTGNLVDSPIEDIKESGECLSPQDNLNPFEVDEAHEDDQSEAKLLKKYQATLQDLKEEITRLNKQIELKAKLARPEPSDEELFKIRTVCRLTKAEAKALRTETEQLAESNAQLSESIENLKDQSASKPATNERVLSLTQKLRGLEKELQDLSKTHEVSLQDLEKVMNPEVTQKFVNEFYVNVQKRVDMLETENNSLNLLLKKNSVELSKLKEKLENSTIRKKANDEIKNKLKSLEETYENYIVTEGRLKNGIKESLEELSFYSDKQENQHDTDSARNILKDMREQVRLLELEEERLEFVLQEKRNFFRAKQVYGLQRSKTSNKLRSDMELLGMVSVEKEQMLSRMKREIDEINIRTHKVQIDIKEIQDRKNAFN